MVDCICTSAHHGELRDPPGSHRALQRISSAEYLLQKPIILQGHERSLTQIVFNADGDLLFSASKDSIVNVWYTSNGERLGTFSGHNGSVWTVACDCESGLPRGVGAGSARSVLHLSLGQRRVQEIRRPAEVGGRNSDGSVSTRRSYVCVRSPLSSETGGLLGEFGACATRTWEAVLAGPN